MAIGGVSLSDARNLAADARKLTAAGKALRFPPCLEPAVFVKPGIPRQHALQSVSSPGFFG